MPALVVGSDNLATPPARLARLLLPALPLAVKAPPLALTTMQQAVQWHRYRTQGPVWSGCAG